MADEQAAERRPRRSAAIRVTAAPTVRLAQLVRSPVVVAPTAGASKNAAVVVELSGARVTVAHGAEPAMVVLVLALLGGGGAR